MNIFELLVVILVFTFFRSFSEKKKIEQSKKTNTPNTIDKTNYEKPKGLSNQSSKKRKAQEFDNNRSLENKLDYKADDRSLEQKISDWEKQLYDSSFSDRDYYEIEEINEKKITIDLKNDFLKGIIFSEILNEPKSKRN